MKQMNLMGITLEDPIVIAPGPWSRGKERMKQAMTCGAGALITETIVSESYPDLRPRYMYDRKSSGVQNIRIYSGMELEDWIRDLSEVNEAERYGSPTKIIASIMGNSPSELQYIARKIERTGIDGIELGLACPMGEGPRIVASDPKLVYEYTAQVVAAVNVPVSVKLGAATGDIAEVARAAERAGASGISAIDTIRCILNIDLETRRPTLSTYGGYSGAPIKPIGLACVAGLVQCTDLPILGIGGIASGTDYLEYVMAGASTCGIGTQILLNGYDVVARIRNEIKQWMKNHEVAELQDIRGCALEGIRSFEEIRLEEKTAMIEGHCKNLSCDYCRQICFKDAVIKGDGGMSINRDICDGCGMCIGACPEGRIKLSW